MTDAPAVGRARTAARYAGAAAVVVAVGSILTATALSPSFAWTAGALSDLGVDPATAWLFDGGLLVAAALAAPYAWALWTGDGPGGGRATGGRRAARLRGGGFAVAVAGMAGVGLFPAGTALHVPAALCFFGGAAATLLVDGVARAGAAGGRFALAAAGLLVAAWPAWGLLVGPALGLGRGVGPGAGPGVAVPEFVGVALFGAWVVAAGPERPWPRR